MLLRALLQLYLADGRLAWTIAGHGQGPRGNGTRIEVRTAEGNTSLLASLPEQAGRIVPNPRGDGIYYVAGGNLRQYWFKDAEPKTVGPFAGAVARLDTARDGQALYAAADAKLWRVTLPAGAREQIRLARPRQDGNRRARRAKVGASADHGSLEPGKIADLVLLDADPLANLKNTTKIWRVIKYGHLFDPAMMREPATR